MIFNTSKYDYRNWKASQSLKYFIIKNVEIIYITLFYSLKNLKKKKITTHRNLAYAPENTKSMNCINAMVALKRAVRV